jgi:hypothetical protein
MRRICRSTSDWLRRDRFTNIALTFPRSLASLEASRTASACTWSKARATSPISSVESTSTGLILTWPSAPSLSLSRRTIPGSCTPAMLSASARSRRSGRTIDRPTTIVNSMASASTMSTMAPTTAAVVIAFFRSPLSREMAESTSCCATEPICLLMVFDMAEYQSSGVVGSLPSDCPDLDPAASDRACCSWEFDRS